MKKDSDWNEFDDLHGFWAEWIQHVSLTESESGAMRTAVIEQTGEREHVRLERQLALINRRVVYSNRASLPFSERYRIYVIGNP